MRVWHMGTWDGIVTRRDTGTFRTTVTVVTLRACEWPKGTTFPLGSGIHSAGVRSYSKNTSTLARSGTPLSRVFSGIA